MAAFGRRLGRTLLDRSRRGSALTPSGGVVCGWAQRVLDQMTVLFDGMATLRREWRRRVVTVRDRFLAAGISPQTSTLLWLRAGSQSRVSASVTRGLRRRARSLSR